MILTNKFELSDRIDSTIFWISILSGIHSSIDQYGHIEIALKIGKPENVEEIFETVKDF